MVLYPGGVSSWTDGRHTHGHHDHKAAYLARLRRIEGQVRGLHRMVDEDTYCIDVLTQVSAVDKALQGVAVGLVEDHLQHCVREAVEAGGALGGRQGGRGLRGDRPPALHLTAGAFG